MSREFKFRAWDNGKMYKCIAGNTDVEDDNFICPLIWNNERNDWLHSDTCKVMQYTGLKDKNGREIFEGDYVKYFNYSKTEFEICKIEWADKYITYVAIDELENEYFIQKIDEERLEIIGNIYENAELLEGEE